MIVNGIRILSNEAEKFFLETPLNLASLLLAKLQKFSMPLIWVPLLSEYSLE